MNEHDINTLHTFTTHLCRTRAQFIHWVNICVWRQPREQCSTIRLVQLENVSVHVGRVSSSSCSSGQEESITKAHAVGSNTIELWVETYYGQDDNVILT